MLIAIKSRRLLRGLPRLLLAGIAISGCQRPETATTKLPPDRGNLQLETVLIGNDSFYASSTTLTPQCVLIVVGAEWGTLVKVRPQDTTAQEFGRIPRNRNDVQLSEGQDFWVLAWSNNPAFVGLVDTQTGNVRQLIIPRHEWGSYMAGPISSLGGGMFAMAALGDTRTPRRAPSGVGAAANIQIFDSTGFLSSTVGTITHQGGTYLTWLQAGVTQKYIHDTLFVLSHEDAVVSVYSLSRNRLAAQLVRQYSLPQYFKRARATEIVRPTPWIQSGGDIKSLTHTPHVARATFNDRGELITVRNYSFVGGERKFWLGPYAWKANEQGIEVYNSDGALLRAFHLPPDGLQWLQADSYGRIFVGDSTNSTKVFRYGPVLSPVGCARFLPEVQIVSQDLPTSHRPIR